MSNLYASVTDTIKVMSVTVTEGHDLATATAIVVARETYLTLGDTIVVDIGYDTDHAVVFTGVVKQIETTIPDNTVTITAYDNMIRAQDYFIAASNPASPLSFSNIAAEDLVTQLMGLAGLTVEADATSFTFGVANPFEVNLTSVYDYCRMISDTLTWSVWAQPDGTIRFANRKPYPMINSYPENQQPGWATDTPAAYTLTDGKWLDLTYTVSERLLRNRVVVYGSEGVYAEASASPSVLPPGFYKTAVLAYPQIVDEVSLAEAIADYNLSLFNRITYTMSINVIGDPSLHARDVLEVTNVHVGVNNDWYVYGCDHQWGAQGYTNGLELRRMETAY